MIFLTRDEIAARIDFDRAAAAIETAYRAASAGAIELPPVGHITFPAQDADCHIKYGYRRGDDIFVIKVATGFPHNDPSDAPTNNGLSLVLSAETGAVRAILHDEMLLTDLRTGIGGAIASRALARADAKQVLIVGTGVQARQQLEAHRRLFDRPLEFAIWGRSEDKAATVANDYETCVVAGDLTRAAHAADIIVTTTPARVPLITEPMVRPGIHITAVGADAPGKHEVEASVLSSADLLVADNRAQCLDHGELSAMDDSAGIVELGDVLAARASGRTRDDQLTIADLTGIAAQDIAIASTILP